MTKLSLGCMALVAALGVGALWAGAAQAREPGVIRLAQIMTTPTGCQWIDAGGRDQDLWCRDADGQAHRTATRRHDDRDYADTGCPRGKLDNGARCVSEGAALRAAATQERYDPTANAPPPFDWRASKTPDGKWRDPNHPDVLIVGDGYRWRRTYVIAHPYGY